jgi:GNAT superfamily N-acetyltransferase
MGLHSGYDIQKAEATMTLTVRAATLADVPIIVEFNRRLAQESEGKILDPAVLTIGVTAALVDPHKALYFLAERQGTVVGQLSITFEWSDWRNGWLWWIQSVYVRGDARRQGVFRALYEHVYQTAKHNPEVIGLRLYVERENHSAQKTYVDMGMEWTSYLVLQRYPL